MKEYRIVFTVKVCGQSKTLVNYLKAKNELDATSQVASKYHRITVLVIEELPMNEC